jgi:TatD DNase family protein
MNGAALAELFERADAETNGAISLVDSHCHLDMEEFSGEVAETLKRARDAGVRRVLLAACDEASSFAVLKLAKSGDEGMFPGVEVWASAGVHPHEASAVSKGLPDELTDLSSNKLVAAIGETGLDFHYDNSPRLDQAEVFERHIVWAKRARKPLIIHLRNANVRSDGDAYREAGALMKKNSADDCGGVIHCFSGERGDAKSALDLGFYISFAGPVTYQKSETLREVARYVPLDRLLCETDSPYLAPQGKRGRRNEPAHVHFVYETISKARDIPLSDLARAVWENAENLFRFDAAKASHGQANLESRH